MYGLLPPGSKGDARVAAGRFAPRLGSTLADWSAPARGLLDSRYVDVPDMLELKLMMSRTGEARGGRGLFGGVTLSPGGDARRRSASLPLGDVNALRQMASRHRHLQELLERTARRGTLSDARIFCSSSTDPYTPLERRLGLTRGCLEVLARYPPAGLVLQTRSPLVVRDAELLARIPGAVASVTVTTDDESVRRRFEPNSPSLARRIEALGRLRAAGVRTQAVDSDEHTLGHCPYPVRLTLLRWPDQNKGFKYSTLISFSETEALPTAELFPTYHERQDVEAGIKQGKGTFSYTKLHVRSPAGIRLLGQFALLFWPNFVHWAADWLTERVSAPFAQLLSQVRTQVRIAANTPAVVLTNAKEQ